jgi:hypothetical protein
MSLRQEQPVVACMLGERPLGFMSRACRLVGDQLSIRRGQHQPAPKVAQVVGEHAQLQQDFVRPEPMTRQSRPACRLLPLLDPLLGGPALVVEPHNGAIRKREIRHDEPDAAREQLANVVFDFRHDPSQVCPTPGLVREALVSDEWLAAGSARKPNGGERNQGWIAKTEGGGGVFCGLAGPRRFYFTVDMERTRRQRPSVACIGSTRLT